jgi:two-component system chemotaxis response regulator CheY
MKSCLIVDDSKPIRDVARRIVEELNFSVAEAGDGRAALKICEDAMPDAILLDWKMPVMDGLEFLRALRASVGGMHPVVIFCTSEVDISHVQDALAAGADEYIMKPFDRKIVREKLASAGIL